MKRNQPVLKKIYARVDIIDYDSQEFSKLSSIYFLGNHSELAKTKEDININNKKLVAALGIPAIKELINEPSIDGGDEWEELDELDMNDLLNTETVIIPTKPINSSRSYTQLKHDIISDMIFYSKDKSDDIMDRIAIVTNINPYKQYLWIPAFNKSIHGNDINLFKHYSNSQRVSEGFPVDSYQFMHEENNISIDNYAIHDVVVLYCISLDAIIRDKSKLLMLANSDAETFETIFNNAINVFYPMIDITGFNQYLIDEKELENKFTKYAFNKSRIKAKLELQNKLLLELDEIPMITVESSDIITAYTMNIILHVPRQNKQILIDTTTLFKIIDISKISEIIAMDLYNVDDSKKNIRLRKLQQYDQYRENLTLVGTVIPFNRKDLVYNKCIIIYFMPNQQYSELILIIDQTSAVWVKSTPNKSLMYTKKEFIDIIQPIVDNTIDVINNHTSAFLTLSSIPHVSSGAFGIISSSTKLSFKFSIGYIKLLNLVIDKLLESGFVESANADKTVSTKYLARFILKYGVNRNDEAKLSQIEIKNINGISLIELLNLDISESNLYIDLLGRLIAKYEKTIQIRQENNSDLALADPMLYNMQSYNNNYSRICQKKFQPIITTKENKNAVEYHNFTFDRPEYYTCPNKKYSQLGFIHGKHERGFCLPCCRKVEQPDVENIRNKCINTESIDDTRQSSYKIDYPIHSITNRKIMNRRIQLPTHIIKLFGGIQLVANGTIMMSHGNLNSIDDASKSFMQTSIILSSIDNGNGEPLFHSMREFILSIIEFIKQPQSQISIMRFPMIVREFTTPHDVIQAIEDKFIRQTIMSAHPHISDMEWNDTIIYIANCMKMNILVLSDDRLSEVKLNNLSNIDINKPVIIILKRLNLEWSLLNQNTKALYLPITTTVFKVMAKSKLVIERIDIINALNKISRLYFKNKQMILTKQFTHANITEFVEHSKQYKIFDVMMDQKICVIGIGSKKLITTISTTLLTIAPKPIDIEPTASLKDMLMFINDYNADIVDNCSKEDINNYKEYIKIMLKSSIKYDLIKMDKFVLKMHKLIQIDDKIIGAIIDVVGMNKVIATELMFISPIASKPAVKIVTDICDNRKSSQTIINIKSLLAFPISQCVNDKNMIAKWMINPLKISLNQKCKTDLRKSFNMGAYMENIYTLAIIEIIDYWKKHKPNDLIKYLTTFIKSVENMPIPQTRIDSMFAEIQSEMPQYDTNIIRLMLMPLFNDINKLDKKTGDAISRIEKSELLNGIELSNLHKWTKSQILDMIKDIGSNIFIETSEFPSFDMSISISDQRDLFYKSDKLFIHSSIYDDIIEFIASDLANPFRRDYLINLQHTLSVVEDIRPHIGEIIFIQQFGKS